VPNTFHKHLPLLFFLCSLTHASFYANQLLHQPALHQALFAETHFYTNQLLHEPALHKLVFPQTIFYTSQLLHKRAFTRTGFYIFYANKLFTN
jgi:hypothetical protein